VVETKSDNHKDNYKDNHDDNDSDGYGDGDTVCDTCPAEQDKESCATATATATVRATATATAAATATVIATATAIVRAETDAEIEEEQQEAHIMQLLAAGASGRAPLAPLPALEHTPLLHRDRDSRGEQQGEGEMGKCVHYDIGRRREQQQQQQQQMMMLSSSDSRGAGGGGGRSIFGSSQLMAIDYSRRNKNSVVRYSPNKVLPVMGDDAAASSRPDSQTKSAMAQPRRKESASLTVFSRDQDSVGLLRLV
jgi:hypothetical protein